MDFKFLIWGLSFDDIILESWGERAVQKGLKGAEGRCWR